MPSVEVPRQIRADFANCGTVSLNDKKNDNLPQFG